MSFKINIAEKSGKTYKLEAEAETLNEKAIHDKVKGEDISDDLKGYEFEITGASDNSGFTALKDVEGSGKKRVLLSYGKAMKKRPRREGKWKLTTPTPKGLRLRKTVRGKRISPEIVQINLKILKQGNKKLSEIFPEQNKPKEAGDTPLQNPEEQSVEQKPEEKPAEPTAKNPKEEIKESKLEGKKKNE